MALSFATPVYWRLPQVRGGLQICFVDITFDSSYPTGGEPLLYSDIDGLDNSIVGMVQVDTNIKTWKAIYDSTANTLIAEAADAEVANTTDLTSFTVTMMVLGY